MTKKYWPGTRVVRSENNAFTAGRSAAVDLQDLNTSAALRSSSTKTVERARAAGADRSSIHGLSKKADTLLATRRRYSPPVEGRTAGEAASVKRQAASKARI